MDPWLPQGLSLLVVLALIVVAAPVSPDRTTPPTSEGVEAGPSVTPRSLPLSSTLALPLPYSDAGSGCSVLSSPITAPNSPVNTSTLGPCDIATDVKVEAGATLVIFATDGLTLGNSSVPTTFYDNGTVILTQDAALSILAGASVTFQVAGQLTIQGDSAFTLTSLCTFVLERGSKLDVSGGSDLVMTGAQLQTNGGFVDIDGSSWSGGDQSVAATVDALTMSGPLTDLNLTGVSVEGVTMTSGLQSLEIQGYYQSSSSGQLTVSGLTVGSVDDFVADDVNLSGVSVTSAQNVTLGRAAVSPDEIRVQNLTLATFVPGTFSVSNAYVAQLQSSGATNVVVSASTFTRGNGGLTNANRTLSVTVSDFSSPLNFNFSGHPLVRLTNVTAPGLTLAGPSNITVRNWAEPTKDIASKPSCGISVTNSKGYVDLLRDLEIEFAGTMLPPQGTTISLRDQILPSAFTYTLLKPTNAVSVFLLTDNITLGTDTFLGDYLIYVTTPSGLNATGNVTLTASGQSVTLTLVKATSEPSYTMLTFAAAAGLAAVTGITVYLWAITRRQRAAQRLPPRASSEPTEEEEAEDEVEAAIPPGGQ